ADGAFQGTQGESARRVSSDAAAIPGADSHVHDHEGDFRAVG
ncbi:hypothetical protein LCGC14_1514150, partial [marine sediment metagenome]